MTYPIIPYFSFHSARQFVYMLGHCCRSFFHLQSYGSNCLQVHSNNKTVRLQRYCHKVPCHYLSHGHLVGCMDDSLAKNDNTSNHWYVVLSTRISITNLLQFLCYTTDWYILLLPLHIQRSVSSAKSTAKSPVRTAADTLSRWNKSNQDNRNRSFLIRCLLVSIFCCDYSQWILQLYYCKQTFNYVCQNVTLYQFSSQSNHLCLVQQAIPQIFRPCYDQASSSA